MDTTILKVSNGFNALMDDYTIGNILNKNLLIRNLALTRCIGKYSMYSDPMYPEIGMPYNVYEHIFNRPQDIGYMNGLIGYNNGITPESDGRGGITDPLVTGERFKKIEARDTEPEKTVYLTNSGSAKRVGGEISLSEAIEETNKRLRQRKYVNFEAGDSINNDINQVEKPYLAVADVLGVAVSTESKDTVRDERTFRYDNGVETTSMYREGLNAPKLMNETNLPLFSDVKSIEKASQADSDGWLLHKTNHLFNTGKINSIIGRFYAKETDEDGKPVYLSRGRNLLKKGSAGIHEGDGYDNPYCRVWTVQHQYSKMTDLIRPRLTGDTFATIAEIQGKYGEGLRPYDGASRLSDMSVLKSNGMVNITPYMDEEGNLQKDSIKRCMFSIENLAWKDIKEQKKTRKTWKQYIEKKKAWGEGGSEEAVGPTLTEEQRGPNGGRIMWFPPYNLKFSEDISTEWNPNTFIGRGEKIYSYVNTERSGSLSFTLLIDHPSIVNKWRGDNIDVNNMENENDILRFFAGCDDLGEDGATQANETREDARKAEGPESKDPKPKGDLLRIKVFAFFPNNYSGRDDSVDEVLNYLLRGNGLAPTGYEVANAGQVLNTPLDGEGQKWYYKVDDILRNERLVYYEKDGNYYARTKSGQNPQRIGNNHDTTGFTLNAFSNSALTEEIINKMINGSLIDKDEKYNDSFFSLKDLEDAIKNGNAAGSQLRMVINNPEIRKKIVGVNIHGYASSHGHANNNVSLSKERAKTIKRILDEKAPGLNVAICEERVLGLEKTNNNVSSIEAKLARSVVAEFFIDINKIDNNNGLKRGKMVKSDQLYINRREVPANVEPTYDDEYLYFKHLDEGDSFIKKRIIEKINYFTPAYHSITPEGFNARLTFLQQCTRQGPTVSASDTNSNAKNTGVGNLSFGRAPYCILRIGDFYNTKILIQNISIEYAGTGGSVQWDLNPEGAGVQPIMADITIRFTFIGGSDISGPIERLQNAVSYNYYSNTSIYDRRADHREAFIERGENSQDGGNKNPVHYWDPQLGNNKQNDTR